MVQVPETIATEWPVAAKPYDPADPRALHLFQGLVPDDAVPVRDAVAPVHLLGVPFDAAVQGRPGCRDGPQAIREALRYASTYDAVADRDLVTMPVVDAGDVAVDHKDTRVTHARAADAVGAIVATGGVPFVLGGDNSLTYGHVSGLAEAVEGRIGIVVVDAHYDLREPKDGVISSGTPFYRILTEMDGGGSPRMRGEDIVEIGIRPFANSRHLAETAARFGVHIVTDAALRAKGMETVAQEALDALGAVDHLWLSIDMDGVDQSHAPGVSAPSPNGLSPQELFHLARTVAQDPRFAGLDVLEVAPNLDPTGNTARVAALLLMHTLGGYAAGRSRAG